MRSAPDHLDFYAALAERPYAFDFFQVLRRIECFYADLPRIGSALKPADEALRLGQSPELSFAPAAIAAFRPQDGAAKPRLLVRFLGLMGPNGPLPLHLTEYVRHRQMHEGDAALVNFLDLLHHRILAVFYRAWAQAQPVVNLDRPQQDRFALYVGSSFGLVAPQRRTVISGFESDLRSGNYVADRDVARAAKLFFAGQLARQIRNRDGLVAILKAYFQVPIDVEQFVGHWLDLSQRERTYLGAKSAMLGGGAVLGARVWDRQHKIRIRIGPLTLEHYENFLPGGKAIDKLTAWLRQYFCFEFAWDVQLILRGDEVPRTRLNQFGRLGWTTWLGKRRNERATADLIIDPERLLQRQASA